MPTEAYVFPQMVEGLYLKGLKAMVTRDLKDKLRVVGINLDKPLLPAYPLDTWYRALAITAQTLFPTHSKDAAYQAIGEAQVGGYVDTTIGRALQGVFKLIGPSRVLGRADKNFRSGNNYTETKMTEIGPGEVDLWINEVGPNPNYIKGVLLAGLRLAGAKELAIKVQESDGKSVTLRIKWQVA